MRSLNPSSIAASNIDSGGSVTSRDPGGKATWANKERIPSILQSSSHNMSKPSTPHLSNRLRQLALASSPTTALFYARLYHALVPTNSKDHDSLHILALCFIQSQQPYSAIHLCRDLAGDAVDYSVSGAAMHNPSQRGCDGCAVIVGRCCEMLGRYTEGKEVMERALRRSQGSVPTSGLRMSSA